MLKKIFSIIFSIIIILTCMITPVSVGAYEVTEFEITAQAGALISLDTDEFLYENNIDKKVYPASITKIMTAIIILENEKFDPEGKITMSKSALDLVLGTGSSVSHFVEGEEFTQFDLVNLVLISSFGDCTYLAAEYYGGSVESFVQMMNDKAKELGLKNTHYSNPVGLHDDDNYTTVRDIYTLTKYALKNKIFKQVCETPRYVMSTNLTPKKTLSTTNALQDTTTNYYYQFAKGVKTGFTDEAGRCLVSTATNNGYTYMCIVMGCPGNQKKHFSESISLYRWAFNNFSFKEVADSTEPVCEIPVSLSFDTDFAPLYFKEKFVTVLPNNADDSTIIVQPHLVSEEVEAPIKKGQVLGTADIIYAEKIIGTCELVAGEDIESSTLLVIFKYIKTAISSIYMKIILIVLAVVVLIFIALCIKLNMSNSKKRKVKYIPYNEKAGKKREK